MVHLLALLLLLPLLILSSADGLPPNRRRGERCTGHLCNAMYLVFEPYDHMHTRNASTHKPSHARTQTKAAVCVCKLAPSLLCGGR